MEEKNLVALPDYIVEYLEYVKKFLSVRGALLVNIGSNLFDKDKISNYLSDSSNQEKFIHAWVNGYKVEEKKFLVRLKNIDDIYCYLNYNEEEKLFFINSKTKSQSSKTEFTKEFLEKNSFGWMLDCEGVELIEVDND